MITLLYNLLRFGRVSSRSVAVNVLDSDIVAHKFELESCYYVHFRANTPRKRYEPSYSPHSY